MAFTCQVLYRFAWHCKIIWDRDTLLMIIQHGARNEGMCIQTQQSSRLDFKLTIIHAYIYTTLADCPHITGFLLGNIHLWGLKSYDGYSMISPGCGDHQISTSHKKWDVRRAHAQMEKGHSYDTGKTGNLHYGHMLSNQAARNFNVLVCTINLSTSLCCFTGATRWFWDCCQKPKLCIQIGMHCKGSTDEASGM